MRRSSQTDFNSSGRRQPPESKVIAYDNHQNALTRWLIAAALLFACAVIIQTAKADAPDVDRGKVSPLHHYDHSAFPQISKIDRRLAFDTHNLDTTELLAVAEFQRHYRSISPQMVLNYQWLYDQQTGDTVEGRKVLTSMLSSGFRLYWNELRTRRFQSQHYIPDGDGHGELNDYWDYRIRLSSNRLRLVISHEF